MSDVMAMKIKGLATGIGSLPHKDADEALDLIFRYLPHMPFWPQLVRRDAREGMIPQFSQNLPVKEEELEKFYEKAIGSDLDYFKITPEYASGLYRFHQRLSGEPELLEKIGYIKCHITGPFTFAAGVKDEKGAALLHSPVYMQAVVKGLLMKALWQIEFFKKFGRKIVIFIDEPYLSAFGSAYTPVNREDVVGVLSELAEGISAEGALCGIHCCGNTDWSMFTESRGVKIINFDAVGFLDKFVIYAEDLRKFLEAGGVICWGIVPTQEFSGEETKELLIERLKQGVDSLAAKGIQKRLLSENLIISPSCGLGSLDSSKAEKILGLLAGISQTLCQSGAAGAVER